MNERYKELEKQCTEQKIDYDVGKMYDQVDHRKLAELIVRECIAQCEQFLDDPDFTIGAMRCAIQLSQHFGVEE
jgi:hypothetical protein